MDITFTLPVEKVVELDRELKITAEEFRRIERSGEAGSTIIPDQFALRIIKARRALGMSVNLTQLLSDPENYSLNMGCAQESQTEK
jgi:hypothetical protein